MDAVKIFFSHKVNGYIKQSKEWLPRVVQDSSGLLCITQKNLINIT